MLLALYYFMTSRLTFVVAPRKIRRRDLVRPIMVTGIHMEVRANIRMVIRMVIRMGIRMVAHVSTRTIPMLVETITYVQYFCILSLMP